MESIDKRWLREMASLRVSTRNYIYQFDNASEDKTKLEIAGRIIFLIQKVMLWQK